MWLSFREPGVEQGFAKTLKPRIFYSMKLVGLMLFAMVAIYLPTQCYDPDCFPSHDHYVVRMSCLLCDVGVGATALAMGITGFVLARRCDVSVAALERIALMFCVAIGALAFCTDDSIMARAISSDLEFPFSDVWPLLSIDVFVTITHLIPVRWSCLVLLEACALCIYPILTLCLAGMFDSGFTITISLLIGCAVVGKRRMEVHERRQFRILANERKLRAQSDFELSKRGRHRVSTGDNAALSEVSARTGATGELFEAGVTSRTIRSTLRRIAEVGRREHWLVSPEDVRIVPSRVLGCGNFGVVASASLRGLAAAVKLSRRSLRADAIDRVPAMISELRVLRQLRHPFIAAFYGALVDPSLCELALVLELVRGPTLERFVDDQPSVAHRYSLASCLGLALQCLHGQTPAIVHGDLKPSNVLVELGGRCTRAKLVDFGLARIVAGGSREMGGSLAWMAPELLGPDPGFRDPNTAADVFTYGRMLHFIMLGCKPYEGLDPRTVFAALQACDLREPEASEGDHCVVVESSNLACRCMTMPPDARPTMEEHMVDLHRIATLPEARELLGETELEFLPKMQTLPWEEGVSALRKHTPNMAQYISEPCDCSGASRTPRLSGGAVANFSCVEHEADAPPPQPPLSKGAAPGEGTAHDVRITAMSL